MKYLTITVMFSFLLCSCNKALPENRNQSASLPEKFNFEAMKLTTITTFINTQNHTTSTLYGNENACAAILNPDSINNNNHKTLVCITWKQQDDPNWFGAKIPGQLASIETLTTDTHFKDTLNIYYKFLPGGHSEKNTPIPDANKRIKAILALRPAVMP